jgi:hypothetical protein
MDKDVSERPTLTPQYAQRLYNVMVKRIDPQKAMTVVLDPKHTRTEAMLALQQAVLIYEADGFEVKKNHKGRYLLVKRSVVEEHASVGLPNVVSVIRLKLWVEPDILRWGLN